MPRPEDMKAALVRGIGTDSAHRVPDKLQRHGVALFEAPGHPAPPLVQGCAAWLVCRVIPEPHNQQTYDLFIGEVVAAWADVVPTTAVAAMRLSRTNTRAADAGTEAASRRRT